MNTPKLPTWEQIEAEMAGDNRTGWCLACGAECEQIEPDTRGDICPACGAAKVWAAEELCIAELYR